jgi:outer membrane murein-binding lipoprotein Lpp
MSLDYASFVPDLIAAVKELSARVVQLEAQMESLKHDKGYG